VTKSDWDEMMAVNLNGLFFCCQAAARHLLAGGYGRIINMSSRVWLASEITPSAAHRRAA
jgi:NAD(P)-dependent dehydrogenase (short-subunit alcohol dehydrogenase family)